MKMDYNEQKNVFIMLTYIVVSVTMYVTSANYICYERLKYAFFEVKTLLLYLLSNTIRL